MAKQIVSYSVCSCGAVTQIECGVIFGEVAFTDKNTDKDITIQILKTFLPNNMLNKNQQELNDFITANDARENQLYILSLS